MSIPILVEPTANGYRANTGGPLNLCAEAATSADAIAAIESQIAARSQLGTMIVQLPKPRASTLPKLPLVDEETWNQFLAGVEDYRNQCNVEDGIVVE